MSWLKSWWPFRARAAPSTQAKPSSPPQWTCGAWVLDAEGVLSRGGVPVPGVRVELREGMPPVLVYACWPGVEAHLRRDGTVSKYTSDRPDLVFWVSDRDAPGGGWWRRGLGKSEDAIGAGRSRRFTLASDHERQVETLDDGLPVAPRGPFEPGEAFVEPAEASFVPGEDGPVAEHVFRAQARELDPARVKDFFVQEFRRALSAGALPSSVTDASTPPAQTMGLLLSKLLVRYLYGELDRPVVQRFAAQVLPQEADSLGARRYQIPSDPLLRDPGRRAAALVEVMVGLPPSHPLANSRQPDVAQQEVEQLMAQARAEAVPPDATAEQVLDHVIRLLINSDTNVLRRRGEPPERIAHAQNHSAYGILTGRNVENGRNAFSAAPRATEWLTRAKQCPAQGAFPAMFSGMGLALEEVRGEVLAWFADGRPVEPL